MKIVNLLTGNGKAFIRLLGAVLLLGYVYRVLKALITEQDLNLNGQHVWVFLGSIGVWVAYEVVIKVYADWVERKSK